MKDESATIEDGRHDFPVFIHSALDDLPLTMHAFRVYCHLARRAGRDGVAWPSYASMGEHCFRQTFPNSSTETVRRAAIGAIEELEAYGLIVKTSTRSEKGGPGRNHYRLTSRDEWKAPESAGGQGGSADALGGSADALGGSADALGGSASAAANAYANAAASKGSPVSNQGSPDQGSPSSSSVPGVTIATKSDDDPTPAAPERAKDERANSNDPGNDHHDPGAVEVNTPFAPGAGDVPLAINGFPHPAWVLANRELDENDPRRRLERITGRPATQKERAALAKVEQEFGPPICLATIARLETFWPKVVRRGDVSGYVYQTAQTMAGAGV